MNNRKITTVGELIEELNKLPKDATIGILQPMMGYESVGEEVDIAKIYSRKEILTHKNNDGYFEEFDYNYYMENYDYIIKAQNI